MTNDLAHAIAILTENHMDILEDEWARDAYDFRTVHRGIGEMLASAVSLIGEGNLAIPLFVVDEQALYGTHQIVRHFRNGRSYDELNHLAVRYVTETADAIMEYIAWCTLTNHLPRACGQLHTYHIALRTGIGPMHFYEDGDVRVPSMVPPPPPTEEPVPLSKSEQKRLATIRTRFAGIDFSKDGA